MGLIPSFARRGRGVVLIIFQKPLQPPFAKGRISQPIIECLLWALYLAGKIMIRLI